MLRHAAARAGDREPDGIFAGREVGERQVELRHRSPAFRQRLDFAHRLAEEGGRLEIAPDLPEVRGEPTLLGRLFTNLVDNALTYRRPGEGADVRIDWREAGERIEVRVSDRGVGIAPEHQGKVFDVFQRLHGDEEFAGTGIGLAVVKKVADLLDGEVRVESEPGKGSTFIVALPRPRTAEATTDGEEDE